MKRRGFLGLMSGLAGAAAQRDFFGALLAEEEGPKTSTGIIGMYVHQHWPYNHPYAPGPGQWRTIMAMPTGSASWVSIP